MIKSLFKYTLFMFGALLVVLQIYVHFDAVISPLQVKNEFYYLDQKTKLSNGEIVSNQKFDETLIFNPQIGSEAKKINSLKILTDKNARWDVNSVANFQYYFDAASGLELGNRPKFINKFRPFILDSNHDTLIFYTNEQLFQMYRVDCINVDDMDEVRSVVYSKWRIQKYDKDLEELLPECESEKKTLLPLIYANTQPEIERKIEYIEKNFDEKKLQVMDRYYFHENAFVLNPINDLIINRPKDEIFSQYGYLSAVAIKKCMEFIGGISYPNYEKTVKFSYLLYYLLLLYTFISCFRHSVPVVVLLIAFAAYSLYANSYYFYTYPPGHAPFRHFLDIIVFLFLWRARNRGFAYYISAVLLAGVSILVDRDIGAIIALATIGAVSYEFMQQASTDKIVDRKLFFLIVISLVCCVFCYVGYPLANSPSSKYFLDGFYSFGVKDNSYILLLCNCLLMSSIALFLGGWLYKRGCLLPYMYAAIYSSFLLFYYIWGGGHGHFRVFIILYYLPYFVLLYCFLMDRPKFEVYISILAAILIVNVLPQKVSVFFDDKKYSMATFNNHVTYTWTLPRAKGMITKIDPKPFELAVELIDKYEGGNGFAPISKYDSMLSFLVGKYSTNPYFDLRSFIVTEDDYKTVRESLLKNKTIFVDVDIDRDFDLELSKLTIWNQAPMFFYEHYYQRLGKLMVLKRLYKDIIADGYQEVDRSGLIAVYQRK